MSESNRTNLEIVESPFDIAYIKVSRALALCDVMAIAATADGDLFDDTSQTLSLWLVDELMDVKAALKNDLADKMKPTT